MINTDTITKENIKSHGLTTEEYNIILNNLNHKPNIVELGIFSAMWSEHCSYKSSKIWLKKLHTTGKCVICGPGENAGVIDIGDNQAIVFKIESHNHPSFIEPYQGATTGVGGIMRDIFTMGARPIANMNALYFGDPNNHKTQTLVDNVVDGIGDYGNSMGVPTVGGKLNFNKSYNTNNLVNTMCIGLTKINKIFYSAATGVGNPIIYVGSKTGRDGIHGATMASTEFNKNSKKNHSTIQVGDPFVGKLLLEACLELMKKNYIIAIQDMGAAGLTSSSIEMADKGKVGLNINLDNIPKREKNMTAYEILLSESQERMLIVLKKGYEEKAKNIFVKWGLSFAIIGITTDTNQLIITDKMKIIVNIPINLLINSAPIYKHAWIKNEFLNSTESKKIITSESVTSILLKLINSSNYCSRKWVWEQYDYMIMGDTIQPPGGDAAVIRIHNTNKAIAISIDVTPRYVYSNPIEGSKQAVVETWRNITSVGAQPLAITNCMNFGNPKNPKIMGQFVNAIKGITKACLALNYPVVSGNVSFYNETNGNCILPTPTIGGVGILQDISNMTTLSFKKEGDTILLIGEENGYLNCSAYSEKFLNKIKLNQPPKINLNEEIKNGNFIRYLINSKQINAAHDISDGGLYVAIAEMAMASNLGANIKISNTTLSEHAILFGEDQARYIITTTKDKVNKIFNLADNKNITIRLLGKVIKKYITINNTKPISVSKLQKKHEEWLPNFMDKH